MRPLFQELSGKSFADYARKRALEPVGESALCHPPNSPAVDAPVARTAKISGSLPYGSFATLLDGQDWHWNDTGPTNEADWNCGDLASSRSPCNLAKEHDAARKRAIET